MGIISKFFGKKPKSRPPSLPHSNEFLKKATAHKRKGEWDEAIRCLKTAYQIMTKEGTSYGIKPYLKLPQYLQAAGRNEESWEEFNNLLLGYPYQTKSAEVITMEHSIVYDKMRLFLQRKGRNDSAVVFGVMSYLCWGKGLKLQKRGQELRDYRKSSSVRNAITPLLKKAKRMNKIDELGELLNQSLGNLPELDLAVVKTSVLNLLKK